MAPKPTAPTCLVHAGSLCPRLPSSIQSALRGANPGPNLRHKVQAFRVRTNSPDPLVAIANHYRTQDTRVSDTDRTQTVSPHRCQAPCGNLTPGYGSQPLQVSDSRRVSDTDCGHTTRPAPKLFPTPCG